MNSINVNTGLKGFDEIYGSLKRGTLTVIAGRPGMGKTSLLENIKDNIKGSVIEFKALSQNLYLDFILNFCEEREVDFIGIDYLQQILIKESNKDRKEEIAIILDSLRQLAKKQNCAIILISQLNRSTDVKEDHKPTLQDFAYSEIIEEKSDNIFMLYRDDYYNENGDDKLQIIVGK